MGALNASKMKFCFDEHIQINVVANFTQIYEYENLHIKKGERLGNFVLGSTIVMLSEKDATKFNLFKNKELKFTEAIGFIK
ncbi:phosphatidylserine decarboxylase [Campylobacter concisus]